MMTDTLPTFCAYHPLYVGSEFQIRGTAPRPGDELSHGICVDCYLELCRIDGIEPNQALVESMRGE